MRGVSETLEFLAGDGAPSRSHYPLQSTCIGTPILGKVLLGHSSYSLFHVERFKFEFGVWLHGWIDTGNGRGYWVPVRRWSAKQKRGREVAYDH